MLLILLLLAAGFDLLFYRIPNQLILSFFTIGILYQILLSGIHFYLYIIGAFLLLLCFIPIFKLHIIGGGDVKLFCLCALFLGLNRALVIVIYAFVLAAIASVFVLAFHFLKHFFIFKKKRLQGTFALYMKDKKTRKLHFSIYILVASLIERFLFFFR